VNRAVPTPRTVGARAAALVAAAALAASLGCQEERVEYQYRPGYMTDPNAPSEVTLADGTRVVFVDTPIGQSTIDRDRIKNPKPKPVKLGPDGKPIPVKQFEPREQTDDGKVILRNITPDHVVANTMQCMRLEEYRLIWDQLLAPETRSAYERSGGYEAFAAWCATNRRPTMELLNRMRFNAMGSDVVMDKVSPTRMRARLSPHLWDQFKLRVIDFEMTDDGMKLVSIQPN
jgi:hypothetical protein